MLDHKKAAELDQASAMLAETFPPMLWRLFNGLAKEGFTKEQALHLTTEYFKAVVMRPSQPGQ